MAYVLHGLTLALAWFLAVNVSTSALVAWVATCDVRTRSAAFWFALRMLPAVTAMLFVAAVFVPSHWRYEPRDTLEGFDFTLIACAVAAGGLLAAAGVRGLLAWSRARARARAWIQSARPLVAAGAGISAFEVETERPLMALVGVLRPSLLVARGLVEALSNEELAACVVHELGHSHAW